MRAGISPCISSVFGDSRGPRSKQGQARMYTLEISASGMLANVPFTKERHKTKLRFQEFKKKTAFLDRKGGKFTLQMAVHIGHVNTFEALPATFHYTNLPLRGEQEVSLPEEAIWV